MNEGIGSRGGRNDRRRSFKIKLRQKKKLKELEKLSEEKALEKKIRKNQILKFITIIPIALFGNVIKNLIEKDNNKQKEVNETKEKQEIKTVSNENKNLLENKTLKNEETINVIEEDIKISNEKIEKPVSIIENNLDEKLEKIKSKKIIEKYEEKIKEIRYMLRNVYYEATLINEFNGLDNSPSEENIEKLTELISKLELLKDKLDKNENLKVDENYIEVLVEEDLEKIEKNIELENENNNILYKSISNKISELKIKKDKTEEKLKEEKIQRNIDEDKIIKIKEKKHLDDNFNNELLQFQYEQDKIIKDIQNKVSFNINKIDIPRIKLNGISKQTNLLLKRIKIYMRVPGVRSGRKILNLTSTYLYSIQNSFFRRENKIRYKRVNNDYFLKELETNINELTNILENISKTKFQLEKVIEKVISTYSEYSHLEEYQKLLNNLNVIKKNLEEKEFELKKLKEEQQKKQQIENENAKIYKL